MRCARPAFLRWVSAWKSCTGPLSRRVSGSIVDLRLEEARSCADTPSSPSALFMMAPLGAKRRRPRRVVGGGVQPGGGRRRSGRSSPPSSDKSGKQVELSLPSTRRASGQDRGGHRGRPPARLRLRLLADYYLHAEVGPRGSAGGPLGRRRSLLATCSIRISSTAPCCSTRRTGPTGPCTRLPMGYSTNHIHVWKSLLERAGFALDDIPKEWEAVLVVLVRPGPACGAQGIAAATTSGAVALPMSAEARRYTRPVLPVRRSLRCGLRDPRWQAGHRRPGDQAQAHQGHRQLHGDLSEGLHPARFGDLG